MVHIIARPEGLRIKKDPVASYKLPGICGAVVGCIFFIIGLGIGIVGYSNTSKDDKETANSIKVIGPILCIIGIAMLIAGFTYKYVMHHRYKKLQREKYIVRPKSGRSARSAHSARSARSRSAHSARRSPGDGDSQIVSDDLHYHLEELGVEIGESSSPDMFMTQGSASTNDKETIFDEESALRTPKTTDTTKVKSSKSKAVKTLQPTYGTYSEGYVNEAYSGPLPEGETKKIDIFQTESVKVLAGETKKTDIFQTETANVLTHTLDNSSKKKKKKSPRSPRPNSGKKQHTPRETADGTADKMADNNNIEAPLEGGGLKDSELVADAKQIPQQLTNITRKSKFSRRETLALHEEANVEEIPDLSSKEDIVDDGVLMNVNKLPTITIEEEDEFDYDF